MPPPADDPVEIVITGITARQLKALLDSDHPSLVLDVREAYELPTQDVIPGSISPTPLTHL